MALTAGDVRPRRGTLVVVGTGIKIADHTTPEALKAMREAEKLLYLVADDIGDAWVRKLNPTAESLKDAYVVGRPRRASYLEMLERILAPVRAGLAVCAAFYVPPRPSRLRDPRVKRWMTETA